MSKTIHAYYIGTVSIECEYPEDTPDLLPESKIREIFTHELSEMIKQAIMDAGFDGTGDIVKVERRHSNVYSTEDK